MQPHNHIVQNGLELKSLYSYFASQYILCLYSGLGSVAKSPMMRFLADLKVIVKKMRKMTRFKAKELNKQEVAVNEVATPIMKGKFCQKLTTCEKQ